jgi:hypothetical protein
MNRDLQRRIAKFVYQQTSPGWHQDPTSAATEQAN